MSIDDLNPILSADLDALTTTSLAAMQDDNEGKPLAFNVNFHFHNLVAGTAANRRRAIWVPPYDYYLEALCVEAGDQTAASTVQAAVTGDGTMTEDLGDNTDHGEENGIAFWPVKVSGAAGAGRTKLARVLLDNTKGKPKRNFPAASQAFRTLLQGSTITVSAKTTSIATPSRVTVTLQLRAFWARS
jgi:hypothetical protein